MKNRLRSIITSGVVIMTLINCSGTPKKEIKDTNITASDGSTQRATTITTGAVVFGVVGGLISIFSGTNSPNIVKASIASSALGAAVGDSVADNNEKQAKEEKLLADKEADYETKIRELQEKGATK